MATARIFIDMTYRQVIMHGGAPFSLEIPNKLKSRDSISQVEYNKMTATGKENDSLMADETFGNLR